MAQAPQDAASNDIISNLQRFVEELESSVPESISQASSSDEGPSWIPCESSQGYIPLRDQLLLLMASLPRTIAQSDYCTVKKSLSKLTMITARMTESHHSDQLKAVVLALLEMDMYGTGNARDLAIFTLQMVLRRRKWERIDIMNRYQKQVAEMVVKRILENAKNDPGEISLVEEQVRKTLETIKMRQSQSNHGASNEGSSEDEASKLPKSILIMERCLYYFNIQLHFDFFKQLVLYLALDGGAFAKILAARILHESGRGSLNRSIVENFQYIFCDLLYMLAENDKKQNVKIHCLSVEEKKKRIDLFRQRFLDRLRFVASLTDYDFNTFMGEALTRGALGPLRIRLMSNMNEREFYSRIGLSIVLSVTNNRDYTHDNSALDEQIRYYVHPFLAGFTRLFQECQTVFEKEEALKSMGTIFEIMGKEAMAEYDSKAYFVLKNITIPVFKQKALIEASLYSWHMYINNLTHKSLLRELRNLITYLTEFLPFAREKASSILKEIASTHSRELKINLHRQVGFMLPKAISESLRFPQSAEYEDFFEILKDNLAHNDSQYRRKCLEHFRDTLKAGGSRLLKELPVSSLPNRKICNVLEMMLRDASTEETQSIVGECLGLIGALDPAKIIPQLELNSQKPRIYVDVMDQEFARSLFYHLTDNLSQCDDESNVHSFALQELIKIYRIRTTDVSGDHINHNSVYWTILDEDVKQKCQPLLKSRFKNTSRSNEKASLPDVINACKTTSEWLATWIQALISKLKNDKAVKIFGLCVRAIREGSTIGQFLLPHVVIAFLKEDEVNDNDIANYIINPITSVAERQDQILSHSEEPSPLEQQQNEQSDLLDSQANRIFHLLDYLNEWYFDCLETSQNELKALSTLARNMTDPKTKTSPHEDIKKRNSRAEYLVSQLPKKSLAYLAFRCNAYARSLRYLEEYFHSVSNIEEAIKENAALWQKLYLNLNNLDGVLGVNEKRGRKPTLTEEVITHEANGAYHEAIYCAERALEQNDPPNLQISKDFIRCNINMDKIPTAQSYVEVLAAAHPEWAEELHPYRFEAAWRLKQWGKLEDLQGKASKKATAVGVGNLILACYKNDVQKFKENVQDSQLFEVRSLSIGAADVGRYSRVYPRLVNLHAIRDVEILWEKFASALRSPREESGHLNEILDGVVEEWNSRSCLIERSFRALEPVLCIQRTFLHLFNDLFPEAHSFQHSLSLKISRHWLQSATLARKSGSSQMAFNKLALVDPEKYINDQSYEVSPFILKPIEAQLLADFIIEKAKITAMGADTTGQNQAVQEIEKVLDKHFQAFDPLKTCDISQALLQELQDNPERYIVQKAAFTRLQLLRAKYCDSLRIRDSADIEKYIQSSMIYLRNWEKPHYSLAKFLDKRAASLTDEVERANLHYRVARSFLSSLKRGANHVHESLSRVLEIWFDLGDQLYREIIITQHQQNRASNSTARSRNKVQQNSKLEELKNCVKKMNDLMYPKVDIPSYLYMTCFSQLASKITHQEKSVSMAIKTLICHLLLQYPHQVMWRLMHHCSSEDEERVEACKYLFASVKKSSPEAGQIIESYLIFCDRIKEMLPRRNQTDSSTKHIPPFSLKNQYPQLVKFMRSTRAQIVLPFESQLNACLPGSFGILSTDSVNLLRRHEPYPKGNDLIYMETLDDKVVVLPSLCKPKKLSVRCSDGGSYTLLCKSPDDQRKDMRVMEFNDLVNRLLTKDTEAFKRNLKLRTYAVTPMSDWSGIIEWIPNLCDFKSIMDQLYTQIGSGRVFQFGPTLSSYQKAVKDRKMKETDLIRKFEKHILEGMKPPQFHKFFSRQFNDATSWLLARLQYARAVAVISIVGYILGLGDRHSENMLIHEPTGQVVHVDYNCIFNQGEALGVPELVPFRLTLNVVDGFGPMGVEGVFRKSCEITLKVLRSHSDILMSFIKPLASDPHAQWHKIGPDNRRSMAPESQRKAIFNEDEKKKCQAHIIRMENRLKGIETDKKTKLPKELSLSCEGQVKYVIEEATSSKNLAQMFPGWSPWL